jgi:hypothetical protein
VAVEKDYPACSYKEIDAVEIHKYEIIVVGEGLLQIEARRALA